AYLAVRERRTGFPKYDSDGRTGTGVPAGRSHDGGVVGSLLDQVRVYVRVLGQRGQFRQPLCLPRGWPAHLPRYLVKLARLCPLCTPPPQQPYFAVIRPQQPDCAAGVLQRASHQRELPMRMKTSLERRRPSRGEETVPQACEMADAGR